MLKRRFGPKSLSSRAGAADATTGKLPQTGETMIGNEEAVGSIPTRSTSSTERLAPISSRPRTAFR
jgi:hypothetical protein